MARDPIPTWFFALVVVRRNDEFLLVHERKHGQHWYLPAGRVEVGESMEAAAIRETLEETSVPIELDGIVRFEHTVYTDSTRLRVIFTAKPVDDTLPKSEPDDESLEAGWFTLDEMKDLPLRSYEVLRIFNHIANGGTIYPMDLLSFEGAPFV